MVVKEWSCKECSTDFEGLLPVCPECGCKAQRAFRTPVRINSTKTKRFDQILESEMRLKGMSNYSNANGVSTPTFTGKVQHGAIRGSWGPEALDGFVAANGVPLAPPPISLDPVKVEAGQVVRNQAGINRIVQRSFSVGRTDNRGHQVAIPLPK